MPEITPESIETMSLRDVLSLVEDFAELAGHAAVGMAIRARIAKELYSSLGVTLIAAERWRQVHEEGWSAEHDSDHEDESLLDAAIAYAGHARFHVAVGGVGYFSRDPWPGTWSRDHDKRGKHPALRKLVIAGALIAAEIDRRLRECRDDGPRFAAALKQARGE